MSDWIEAAEQATTRLGYEASSEAWAFLDGARWMREALLSDESIEQAALGIHASHDRGDWDEELPVVQDEYLDMARAGLARLMEGESNG